MYFKFWVELYWVKLKTCKLYAISNLIDVIMKYNLFVYNNYNNNNNVIEL